MTLEELIHQEGTVRVKVREFKGKKYILYAWRHSSLNFINGYVGVPKESKLYKYHEGYDFNDLDGGWLDIYQGCTFAGGIKGMDMFDEGHHFIGFDTGHITDLEPNDRNGNIKDMSEEVAIEKGYKTMEWVWEQIEDVFNQIKERE
tara:strand:+ start:27663 stop:28100 length:438 start_codon:yes stop_codon:yes gene_type:complete